MVACSASTNSAIWNAQLRPGNVHSAGVSVLKPVIVRYQGKVLRFYFRADAAFAISGVYECLEAERIKYAIRLPANQVLQNRMPDFAANSAVSGQICVSDFPG